MLSLVLKNDDKMKYLHIDNQLFIDNRKKFKDKLPKNNLAIFNSNEFGEQGTTFNPNKVAKGMVHVLVNGTFAMRNGDLKDERAGKVIRKK